MYKQYEKQNAVKEIQRFLYAISDGATSAVPRVSINGIFDKRTKEAVRIFQRSNALTESGEVDFITFNLLNEEYRKIMRDKSVTDYIFGDGKLPLKEGDQNEDVRAMHLMINELSKHYYNVKNVGNGAYFSRRTRDAILELRDLFILPGEPILDKELYERIKAELAARKLAAEKYD